LEKELYSKKLLDAEEEIVQEDRIRPEYDPQTYIAMIPTDQKVIDSISDERTLLIINWELSTKKV